MIPLLTEFLPSQSSHEILSLSELDIVTDISYRPKYEKKNQTATMSPGGGVSAFHEGYGLEKLY